MNRSIPLKKRNGPARGIRGMTTPGCLFSLVVLAILGFAGLRFGLAYWDYYQVREGLREVITWAVAGKAKQEAAIVQKVIARVGAEPGLQLTPRNIRIVQTTASMTISVYWIHDLDFWVYTYPLEFEASLTEAKRWGGRGLVVK